LAAKSGHLAAVKLLADSGAKLTDDITEAGSILLVEIGYQLKHKEVAKELFRRYTTRNLLYHQAGLGLGVLCDDFEFACEHIADVSAHDEGSLGDCLDIAIALNRTRFASLFIQHGAKPSARSDPLRAAARKGNRVLIQLLLDTGERANIWEAVRISLQKGSFAAARLLLAKIDHSELAEREIGKTLELAAETECEDVARSLVENFNAHKQIDYVEKALTQAAEHGHVGILRLLLEKTGMALELTNEGHLKILALGLVYDNASKLLIKAVATWKGVASASEILGSLCGNGDKQAAKLLLDEGVRPDSNTAAASPLHVACIHGHLAVARLLLQHGASLGKRDPRWGQTGLTFAIEMGQNAVAKMLLEAGANTETRRNGDGYTPLLFAAQEGNALGARLLLADGGGALPDTPDNDGRTPLMVAAEAGQGAVARTLLERGARIDAVSGEGMTALHYVAARGRQAVARILLGHPGGVGLVHREDKSGKTPLALARETGRVKLAQLLVERGGGESIAVPGGGEETAADEAEIRSEAVEKQEEVQERGTVEKQEEKQEEVQESRPAGADTQTERVEDHTVAHEAEQISSSEQAATTGGGVVEEREREEAVVSEEEAVQTTEASSPSFWSRLRICLLCGGANG
jgi:ankyrin repeat protein